MAKRIVAVIFIYICTVTAWMTLGSSVKWRTRNQDTKLKSQVGQLWGTTQRQPAPLVYYVSEREVKVETKKESETVSETKTEVTQHFVPLEASDIKVNLELSHRKKGLLWYSTYRVRFAGKFLIRSSPESPRGIFVDFIFPNKDSVYDDFRVAVNGRELQNIRIINGGVTLPLPNTSAATSLVEISYESQGLEQWWYDFGSDVTQVKNFSLIMTTDFDEIDFPENSISPVRKERAGAGWSLTWDYRNLLSGVKIGMAMPQKLNPGPWVSRVIFSAPISLFLFFFLLSLFILLRGIKIHPMNYFFLGAAFFSFHLLLAYLVDHISIHFAFAVASFVSILLVVSYLRLVTGLRFALVEAGLSQFVYLVLFSYTFFFEEFTGLAVTILCVLTLFLVMQLTGKVDWGNLSEVRRPVAAVPGGVACPYCREPLHETTMNRCSGCGTLHHVSCWTQHGGCAIYGCRALSSTIPESQS